MSSPDELAKAVRLANVAKFFTPSAPVSTVDLFAGRLDQIVQVLSALNQVGRHVVLYGERGVGKTSLANLITEFRPTTADEGRTVSTRVNCSTQDSFKTIWIRVFKDLHLDQPESWAFGSPDPDEIRVTLDGLDTPRLIVLDEFDRWEDDDGLSLMADLIKSMADHAVGTKLVIVGVADSLEELVGEHESIQRKSNRWRCLG